MCHWTAAAEASFVSSVIRRSCSVARRTFNSTVMRPFRRGSHPRLTMKRSPYLVLFLLLLLSVGSGRTQYVSAGDNDETLCPVHHVLLKRGKLGLFYGLVAKDPCDTLDRIKARENYFPYANSSRYYGGSVRYSDSPDYKEVLYCPKCREVENTWPCLETHGTPSSIIAPPRITILPTVN
jgi:hypothetical protein